MTNTAATRFRFGFEGSMVPGDGLVGMAYPLDGGLELRLEANSPAALALMQDADRMERTNAAGQFFVYRLMGRRWSLFDGFVTVTFARGEWRREDEAVFTYSQDGIRDISIPFNV